MTGAARVVDCWTDGSYTEIGPAGQIASFGCWALAWDGEERELAGVLSSARSSTEVEERAAALGERWAGDLWPGARVVVRVDHPGAGPAGRQVESRGTEGIGRAHELSRTGRQARRLALARAGLRTVRGRPGGEPARDHHAVQAIARAEAITALIPLWTDGGGPRRWSGGGWTGRLDPADIRSARDEDEVHERARQIARTRTGGEDPGLVDALHVCALGLWWDARTDPEPKRQVVQAARQLVGEVASFAPCLPDLVAAEDQLLALQRGLNQAGQHPICSAQIGAALGATRRWKLTQWAVARQR